MDDVDRATAQAVLDTPMGDNDANAATVREYLTKLLRLVWQDGECFDGKRPFGNSSWEYEIYTALARAGHIYATLAEDGHYISHLSRTGEVIANALVAAAIDEMGKAS